MVLRPEKEKEAEAIFRKWGLDFAIVGYTTDTLRFVIKHQGEVKADLPIKDLGDQAPEYDRPWVAPRVPALVAAADVPAPNDLKMAIFRILGSPDMSSRRWVWEQYDHLIQSNSAQIPGGDAGVIRIGGGPQGPRRLDGCDATLCRGGSLRGRQTGGCRMLAQFDLRSALIPSLSPTISISAIPSGPRSWAASSRPLRALAPPAGRSTSRSSRATCRSTTRPMARRSCPPPRLAALACCPISRRWQPSPSRPQVTRSC